MCFRKHAVPLFQSDAMLYDSILLRHGCRRCFCGARQNRVCTIKYIGQLVPKGAFCCRSGRRLPPGTSSCNIFICNKHTVLVTVCRRPVPTAQVKRTRMHVCPRAHLRGCDHGDDNDTGGDECMRACVQSCTNACTMLYNDRR